MNEDKNEQILHSECRIKILKGRRNNEDMLSNEANSNNKFENDSYNYSTQVRCRPHWF